MPAAQYTSAETWDRLSRQYHRQLWLERAAVKATVELLDPAPDERCLDVGTGTGELLRQLSRRQTPPRRVTAIDSSPEMLRRVGPLPSGWSPRLGDARHLPLPDGAYDAVTAAYLLHVLSGEDRRLAIGEIARVLRPGGRLACTTPAIPAHGWARGLALALDRLADRGERWCGLRALDPRPELIGAGFVLRAARWSLRGYPSLCVLAIRG